jgi:DNA-binding transcriptional ArsR family regulator
VDARSTPNPDVVAGLMYALSDLTRLRILLALAGGEMNVTALCAWLSRRQPDVSHHLGVLRDGRFVEGRRQGKVVYYRLGPAARSPSTGVMEVVAGGAAVRITGSSRG